MSNFVSGVCISKSSKISLWSWSGLDVRFIFSFRNSEFVTEVPNSHFCFYY